MYIVISENIKKVKEKMKSELIKCSLCKKIKHFLEFPLIEEGLIIKNRDYVRGKISTLNVISRKRIYSRCRECQNSCSKASKLKKLALNENNA